MVSTYICINHAVCRHGCCLQVAELAYQDRLAAPSKLAVGADRFSKTMSTTPYGIVRELLGGRNLSERYLGSRKY